MAKKGKKQKPAREFNRHQLSRWQQQKRRQLIIMSIGICVVVSVLGIVGLLSKKFVRLVIIANIIAWPLAYFLMNKWLQDFAFRTGLGVGTFILSGFIALVIALFSVSYQSFRAAAATPINALRYE